MAKRSLGQRMRLQAAGLLSGLTLLCCMMWPIPAHSSASAVSSEPPMIQHGLIHALAVVSPQDAWAVGDTAQGSHVQALTVHWDGTTWRVISSPVPKQGPSVLLAAAALFSSDVWAVGRITIFGTGAVPLIEHWDGRFWHLVTGPGIGSLTSIAALSSRDIWAVGSDQNNGHLLPIIVHWDGRHWSSVETPNPGITGAWLSAVAALSPNNVWAVGTLMNYSQGTLVEHWDGHRWYVVHSPNDPSAKDNDLADIVALAPDNIWAVGNVAYQPLVEHWNGQRWDLVRDGIATLPHASLTIAFVDTTGALWIAGGTKDMETGAPIHPFLAQRVGKGWKTIPVPGQLITDVVPMQRTLWAATEPRLTDNPNLHLPPAPVIQEWSGKTWRSLLLTNRPSSVYIE